MNTPWFAHYPAAIPAEIDIDRFASLNDELRSTRARFADQPAFTSMGAVMKFRELDEASAAFATWLQKVAPRSSAPRHP